MILSIIKAKKLIERQVFDESYEVVSEKFTKYQKGFYWTNENIDYYLNLLKIENKEKALTVASTGDHIFNLMLQGFKKIDTFDINKLTEYFVFGLKRTLIQEYDYYEFITILNYLANPNISLEVLTEILYNLLPKMEKKYRIFWQEIIDFNYKLQKRMGTNLNLMHMLYINVSIRQIHLNNNTYLLDEYAFTELKNKINSVDVTFQAADAVDLSQKFKGEKYDVILLSNILDYVEGRWGYNWRYEKLEEYVNSLTEIANESCIIYLKYIISYLTKAGVKESIFHDSSIKHDDIKDEIYKVPKQSYNEEWDGIILRRVKIDK